MKLRVELNVSEPLSYQTVSLHELDLSEQQWNEMDENSKKHALQEWANGLSEQPYWVVDNFNVV